MPLPILTQSKTIRYEDDVIVDTPVSSKEAKRISNQIEKRLKAEMLLEKEEALKSTKLLLLGPGDSGIWY